MYISEQTVSRPQTFIDHKQYQLRCFVCFQFQYVFHWAATWRLVLAPIFKVPTSRPDVNTLGMVVTFVSSVCRAMGLYFAYMSIRTSIREKKNEARSRQVRAANCETFKIHRELVFQMMYDYLSNAIGPRHHINNESLF